MGPSVCQMRAKRGQVGAKWPPSGWQVGSKWAPSGLQVSAKWAPSWTARTAASCNVLLKYVQNSCQFPQNSWSTVLLSPDGDIWGSTSKKFILLGSKKFSFVKFGSKNLFFWDQKRFSAGVCTRNTIFVMFWRPEGLAGPSGLTAWSSSLSSPPAGWPDRTWRASFVNFGSKKINLGSK